MNILGLHDKKTLSTNIVQPSLYVAKPIQSYTPKSTTNRRHVHSSDENNNVFAKIQECNELEEIQSDENEEKVEVEDETDVNIFGCIRNDKQIDDMMKGP